MTSRDTTTQPAGVGPIDLLPEVRNDMSHQLRATWVVTRRELLRLKQDKARMVTMLLQPVLFIFVMGTGLGSIVDTGGSTDFRTFLYPRLDHLGQVPRRRDRGDAAEPGAAGAARHRRHSLLAGADRRADRLPVPGGAAAHRARRPAVDPDQDHPGGHADQPAADHADDVPVRLPVPDHQPARVAGRAHPAEPADLRRPADAALHPRPAVPDGGRTGATGAGAHLVRLAG